MFDTLQTFIAPRLRSFLKLLSIGRFHKKELYFSAILAHNILAIPNIFPNTCRNAILILRLYGLLNPLKTFLTYMIRELKPSNICILTFACMPDFKIYCYQFRNSCMVSNYETSGLY